MPRVCPAPTSLCRYSPLETGPAGFPFPNIIASWMPPTPGGGYEPSRPIYAPFVTPSDLLRPYEHGRSPCKLSRGKSLLAPEVSVIPLLRPTLLAPEQLKGGASDPAARIESHTIRTVF